MRWKALALTLCWLSTPLFAESRGDRTTDTPFFVPRPAFWSTEQDAGASSGNLFKQIGHDFKNVFRSKENFLLLGVGFASAMVARPLDNGIPESRFNSELFEGTNLDHVFEPGQVLGGSLVQVGGAFATWGIGKLTSNHDIADLGRDLVRAQVLSQTFTQVTKFAVHRTRPDGSDNYSFPSGHTSGSFATATVLQRRYGWKAGIPAYGFATYIAASRLSENRHFLSDVIFGAAIGLVAGRTVTFGRGSVRFALSPMLAPGGVGVQVSLLPRE